MSKITISLAILFFLLFLVFTGCQSEPAATPTTEPAKAPMETPAPEPAETTTPPPQITPEPAVPEPETEPAITPPDTTPPSAIKGLLAANAYDGSVNLWWDESTAEDFDHYNVYASLEETADIGGLEPLDMITDIAAASYQVTGLEDGTPYCFAVTAVDESGNEDARVVSMSATPTPMPAGTTDPDLKVTVYQSDKVWAGTTLLPDNHNTTTSRIIEVNLRGEIIWEYPIPASLKRYTNPGFDAELLENGHILYVLPGKGIYEIDRDGNTVWSYLTSKISHDADRLPDRNTIFAFGNNDQQSDAQVTEVNEDGEVVWEWHAIDHFDSPEYTGIFNDGWTHTNAVSRLPNGNTLISPRNFNFMVEVDPEGEVVGTYGEGIVLEQHDPEMLPNGHILAASHNRPQRAVEIDPATGETVWEFTVRDPGAYPIRDANRLPNGNTLITGTTKIIEATADGETVWELDLNAVFEREEAAGLGFYKANRIDPE